MDKKEEALKRLNAMKVLGEVKKSFKNGKLYVSERMSKDFNAILYFAENYEGLLDKVKKFEQKYDSLVYHIILTHTVMGDMYAMLYVSNNEEEWELDNSELREGYAYANVWTPDIGVEEIGEIMVRPSMGGIERTA